MRYQPKPLELPQQLPIVRRRNHFPLLAIAATVLIALLATGLWLRVRTEKSEAPREARSVPSTPSVKEEVVENKTEPPVKAAPRKIHRPRSTRTFAQKQQHEEALAAKEQVVLALRLASEKLKLAQRRTQGASPNQIKNQHKVG